MFDIYEDWTLEEALLWLKEKGVREETLRTLGPEKTLDMMNGRELHEFYKVMNRKAIDRINMMLIYR